MFSDFPHVEMKSFMFKSLSFYIVGFLFWSTWVLSLLQTSQAQTNGATDPNEVRAINSLFGRWNLSAITWNTSGDPCSGSAIDDTNLDTNDIKFGIKCECNGTVCNIVRVKAYEFSLTGAFPEEVRNLTFLQNLNLGLNSLSGPLPAFIGTLTDMQYLDLGINALSGPLPRELGNLRRLVSLGFGANSFSGSLPIELGNLINLEQVYIDSSGVGGEIPSTFANLKKIRIMRASDNNFTGQIPDFIGNWTNLQDLRFEGNSFEGSIPSSFVNLTSLTELRLSDVSNGSSSLEFITNMKSLEILILRNNRISGTIPSNIGEYRNLTQLDLSFNNITGPLPSALFNLSSLQDLLLGNNSLSGALPSQKGASLKYIDLSYNNLSGSFPSWVSEQDLELNLVANNFMINSSINSILPSGLPCLQRKFLCNQDPPINSSFAIKCGGEAFRSSTGIEFEAENASLGLASYYVSTNSWAVSNVGRFRESDNVEYLKNTTSQITGTLDPKLFQSARASPGSLRYYGLGLENGPYSVNLQFAEITYSNDSRNWRSRGRRVFDIYIQGILMVKDFDIRKEAGGVAFRAIQKDFKMDITENFLEIHLFWAGKGTCCIPHRGDYGPLISAISVTPDFIPRTSSSKTNRTGLVVGFAVAIGVVIFISIFVIFILKRRRKKPSIDTDQELFGMDTRPNTFNYAELRASTEDFSPSNKLGEGGFGPVYKGTLEDERMVAVKQLSVTSHQGKSQFVTEIATISEVQHRNLVKLYGCCIEGDKRLLVYEYLVNKSLDQALFGKSDLHLNWATRYEICLGTARGLLYLHEESRPRIIHRDVKASNILLDAELKPKISDFGLAKLYDDTKTHISTRVAGTIGYLAPEYAMRGHLTEKADVFGFGVVVLEVLSGRQNADLSLEIEKIYLLEWAWHLHENNRGLELVDPTLSEFDEAEAIRLLGVALLCTQASPMLRPSMSRVVAMLSGDIEVSTVTSRPAYLTDWHFHDESITSEDTPTVSIGRTKSSQQTSSSTTSIVSGTDLYPSDTSHPMLHESVRNGR